MLVSLATLDTLDTERNAYAEEISDERRQRAALQAQLRVASAERAKMEAEKRQPTRGCVTLDRERCVVRVRARSF
jgi:Skp family chaperone for outer membrane proteins